MSDNNYQKAGGSPAAPTSLNLDALKQTGPSPREIAIGLGLFSFSIGLYSVYCMLIKLMMLQY